MKKLLFIMLGGLLILGIGATVYARGPWAGGMDEVKQFQKETLALRDELYLKRLELMAEYDKDSPDLDRIAQLRKDIVDLQTRIQKIAQKYDLPAYGPGYGGMGWGMYYGGPIGCGIYYGGPRGWGMYYGGPGYGCGRW